MLSVSNKQQRRNLVDDLHIAAHRRTNQRNLASVQVTTEKSVTKPNKSHTPSSCKSSRRFGKMNCNVLQIKGTLATTEPNKIHGCSIGFFAEYVPNRSG